MIVEMAISTVGREEATLFGYDGEESNGHPVEVKTDVVHHYNLHQ